MAQSRRLELHPDRLFPSDPVVRDIARRLYQQIKDLPIVSPHGHTDPRWFAEDANWDNATALLLLRNAPRLNRCRLKTAGIAAAILGACGAAGWFILTRAGVLPQGLEEALGRGFMIRGARIPLEVGGTLASHWGEVTAPSPPGSHTFAAAARDRRRPRSCRRARQTSRVGSPRDLPRFAQSRPRARVSPPGAHAADARRRA